MYNRPLHDGNWASTVRLGTHAIASGQLRSSTATSFESTLRFRTRNYAWTRIENVERSNELILGENPLPPDFQEKPIGQCRPTRSATIAISIWSRIWPRPSARRSRPMASRQVCSRFTARIP